MQCNHHIINFGWIVQVQNIIWFQNKNYCHVFSHNGTFWWVSSCHFQKKKKFGNHPSVHYIVTCNRRKVRKAPTELEMLVNSWQVKGHNMELQVYNLYLYCIMCLQNSWNITPEIAINCSRNLCQLLRCTKFIRRLVQTLFVIKGLSNSPKTVLSTSLLTRWSHLERWCQWNGIWPEPTDCLKWSIADWE